MDKLIIENHEDILNKIPKIEEDLNSIKEILCHGRLLNFYNDEIINKFANLALDAKIISFDQFMAMMKLWRELNG